MLQTQSHKPIRPTDTVETADVTTRRVRELNDQMRHEFCRFHATVGIQGLGETAISAIGRKVWAFSEFNDDNDPHGEHDFGSFDHDGHKIFWKIEYYSRDLKHGSPDPTDPAVTCRVLTVMLASEY